MSMTIDSNKQPTGTPPAERDADELTDGELEFVNGCGIRIGGKLVEVEY
jgi:hypothetical protein